jgi:hypothetical protein
VEGDMGNKPLLIPRGVLLIDDFSRVTGLDRQAADALVNERTVEGLWHPDGRVFGIYDDALPTRDQLQSWGLDVSDDYDPEHHRSYTVLDADTDLAPDENEPEGEEDRWTLSWDNPEP